MSFDLRPKPLARLDKLSALGGQGSEKAQVFMREAPSSIWAEGHETGNQFSVDPICLGPRAPAGGEGLDLGRRQLARLNASRIEGSPQPPFLPARGLETGHSLSVSCNPGQPLMTVSRVRQPQPVTISKTVNIQPVARDIYADDLIV